MSPSRWGACQDKQRRRGERNHPRDKCQSREQQAGSARTRERRSGKLPRYCAKGAVEPLITTTYTTKHRSAFNAPRKTKHRPKSKSSSYPGAPEPLLRTVRRTPGETRNTIRTPTETSRQRYNHPIRQQEEHPYDRPSSNTSSATFRARL